MIEAWIAIRSSVRPKRNSALVLIGPTRWRAGSAMIVRMLLSVLAFASLSAHAVEFAPVRPGYQMAFPRDHGAHPAFRTEWWYVTGWIDTDAGRPLGFQVTFFRSRTGIGEANPSPFAPRQLLFAHAAIADPELGRLIHDERAAREGFELAGAREGDTDVWIGDWALRRQESSYRARIAARTFTFDLEFDATGPVLLQGEQGYSRKGPREEQASYYYSRPHLRVSGRATINGRPVSVRAGSAWLDHEWSSELMAPEAQGWDWLGVNLHDGGALMAFRMRRADGTALWAAALHRTPEGTVRTFPIDAIRFEPRRTWRSPRSQAGYPVAITLHLAEWSVEIEPLFDDQELDARASVGTMYWEGAVRARRGGKEIGRGYLELTGYWKRLRL